MTKSGLRTSDVLIAAVLFAAMWLVYSTSVPSAFNESYENRRFFDSDCEFIPRQFFLHETYTYNDHLLYHAMARGLYRMTATPPSQPYDSVPQHRWLSIAAGAMSVVLLFLFGKKLSGSTVGSLAAALLIGGCAGWWYFSATIDTYLPHIAASVAALGFAMFALERQRLRDYAYLGVCLGLAFLFRTDGFLLAPLGIVAFAENVKESPRRLAVCATTGALVGLAGYAIIAHAVFDVPFSQVPSWAMGHTSRPGEAAAQWGRWSNVDGHALRLALASQGVFAVILPGLKNTHTAEVWNRFHLLNGGVFALVFHFILLAATISWLIWQRRGWWLALAVLWFIPRTVFYAWWDPSEPFLFACMSLPALWILVIAFVEMPENCARLRTGLHLGFVLFAAAVVWWHNYRTMIVPLRGLHNTTFRELLEKKAVP